MNDGFNTKIINFYIIVKERPGQPKKLKDADLEAILDKDLTQTSKQSVVALTVA